MLEVKGNIWDFHDKGYWIAITTNGNVKKNGEAVMGRGVALQAKERFPDIPRSLAVRLLATGNRTYPFIDYRLFTLPTKYNYWEPSNIELIEESIIELVFHVNMIKLPRIYLPRPGCGNGSLDWKYVKPVLEKYLDDRFIIVQN